jgi:hypothetical protein
VYEPDVEQNPQAEPDNVEVHKKRRAGETRDRIGDAFLRFARGHIPALHFGDGRNVFAYDFVLRNSFGAHLTFTGLHENGIGENLNGEACDDQRRYLIPFKQTLCQQGNARKS